MLHVEQAAFDGGELARCATECAGASAEGVDCNPSPLGFWRS